MFGQGFVGISVTGKEHEGITGGATICLVNKQYALLRIQNLRYALTASKELQLEIKHIQVGVRTRLLVVLVDQCGNKSQHLKALSDTNDWSPW